MPYLPPGGNGKGISLSNDSKIPKGTTVSTTLKNSLPEMPIIKTDSIEIKHKVNLETLSFSKGKKKKEESSKVPKATQEERQKMLNYTFPEKPLSSNPVPSKSIETIKDNKNPLPPKENTYSPETILLNIRDWTDETIQKLQDWDWFVKSRRGIPGGLRLKQQKDSPINQEGVFKEYPGTMMEAKYKAETKFIRQTAQDMIASLKSVPEFNNSNLSCLLSACTSIDLTLNNKGNEDSISKLDALNRYANEKELQKIVARRKSDARQALSQLSVDEMNNMAHLSEVLRNDNTAEFNACIEKYAKESNNIKEIQKSMLTLKLLSKLDVKNACKAIADIEANIKSIGDQAVKRPVEAVEYFLKQLSNSDIKQLSLLWNDKPIEQKSDNVCKIWDARALLQGFETLGIQSAREKIEDLHLKVEARLQESGRFDREGRPIGRFRRLYAFWKRPVQPEAWREIWSSLRRAIPSLVPLSPPERS